ncbi:Hypothetical predicted protein [Pelobates cultripes]|uniref:Uncharacterized protein n=1 Tax=Pelobates cultripes TaxID=61616 RepID=A0AAD1S5P7_PELCU|nr:Hypothetical predicted protein [Pelobates cultripes]
MSDNVVYVQMCTISNDDRNPFFPGKRKCNGDNSLEDEEELMKKLSVNPGDLDAISQYVQKNKGKILRLPKETQLSLLVCDLNGTAYMGQTYMLDSWQSLYLPKQTKMEVLGISENYSSMCSGIQQVVLVAEDGRVFAYEEETMCLIAKTLPELAKNGVRKSEVYFYPHDLSDEEEEKLQQNEEIKKIRARTRDFVNSSNDAFEKILNYF